MDTRSQNKRPATEDSRRPVIARHWSIPVLLWLVSFALLLGSESRDLRNVYDEGLVTFAAARILSGDLPYRDFWGMYSPGQFYALAALFKVFGPSILVERLWDAAIRAGVATMSFLWVRKLSSAPYGLATWLLTTLLLAGMGLHGFPTVPALLFALISAFLLLCGLASARPMPFLIASGGTTALAALFRHDMGFYVAFAEVVTMAAYCVSMDKPATDWSARAARMVRIAIPYGAGLLAVAGPAVALLLAAIPLHDLWFSLFLVPATIYPKVRSLPFPGLPDPMALWTRRTTWLLFSESFSIYFPLAVGTAAAGGWLAAARAAPPASMENVWRRFGVLLLTLITLTMYMKGLVRVQSSHLVQSIIPAIALLFVLIANTRRRLPAFRISMFVVAGIAVFTLVARPAWKAGREFRANVSLVRTIMREQGVGLNRALLTICDNESGLERARCYQPRPSDAAIVRLIQSRTQPHEPIYVGVANHNRIFANNILLYFLTGRPAATKWHESHPGIQTSAAIQAEMIEEFKASGVRYLVLSSEWDYLREANASSQDSGVTILDDYIRANFDRIENDGAVSVWLKRSSTAEGH